MRVIKICRLLYAPTRRRARHAGRGGRRPSSETREKTENEKAPNAQAPSQAGGRRPPCAFPVSVTRAVSISPPPYPRPYLLLHTRILYYPGLICKRRLVSHRHAHRSAAARVELSTQSRLRSRRRVPHRASEVYAIARVDCGCREREA